MKKHLLLFVFLSPSLLLAFSEPAGVTCSSTPGTTRLLIRIDRTDTDCLIKFDTTDRYTGVNYGGQNQTIDITGASAMASHFFWIESKAYYGATRSYTWSINGTLTNQTKTVNCHVIGYGGSSTVAPYLRFDFGAGTYTNMDTFSVGCSAPLPPPQFSVGDWSNQQQCATVVVTNGGLLYLTNAIAAGYQFDGTNWVNKSQLTNFTNGTLRRVTMEYGSGEWAVSQSVTGYHFDVSGQLRLDYGPSIWNTNAPGAAVAAKYGLNYASLSSAEQKMWDTVAGPLQPASQGTPWENYQAWEAGRFVSLVTNQDGTLSFDANIYGTNGITGTIPGDTVDKAMADLQKIIDSTSQRLTNSPTSADTNRTTELSNALGTLSSSVVSKASQGFFGTTPLIWPEVGKVGRLNMGQQTILGRDFVIAVDLDQTFGAALPIGRSVLVFAEAVGFVVLGMRVIRSGVA